ncbi:MAG: hypothetical protein JRC89_14165 [Deltaproteobacteria bacterium]|nr:hypothetical protein [Deltaproteobacteria bacterium]MBW2644457.1 hypothetical protein [Deltaproteobacteria bacterium]
MMNTLDLKNHALTSESGEFIFGLEHTDSHACYMVYGVLKPGQEQRVIKPGKGHEEMVLAMKGNFEISGWFSGRLREGCAFHIAGEDTVYLQNTDTTDACYVIAGGHSHDGHHH